VKRSKWIWSGMGARPSQPPTALEIRNAKAWVKSNLLSNKHPANRMAINTLVPYAMRRVLYNWAWNKIPVKNNGDLFFDRQDVKLNTNTAKTSDLSNTSLSQSLDYDISWRVKGQHELISFIKSLNSLHKDVDYPLRWITLWRNTYPFRGQKLMYAEVARLSRINGSVYNIYAPNIK
jgi:hypothetical protein